MPKVDVTVESKISNSIRARQVSSMFDAPVAEKCTLNWSVDVPIDANDWQVGLIVGPSGSGKSTVMNHIFGPPKALEWNSASVIDDFAKGQSVEQIAAVCQAVGFNTIPAWLRPYAVLSNGEKFRVDLARHMVEDADPVVVDEFTSVVDRQVAQIGSHAVQKYVRKNGRRFVAVTCHYDVLDWLQPDWVLDMATVSFQRRLLQRRPSLECEVKRVPYETWRVFSPFHYLTSDLSPAARCFGLYANGHLASFAGVRHQPHAKNANIKAVSRLVTLPDWQGFGLALALVDVLGAAYQATGRFLHTYPAHPSLIRSFDRSKHWQLRTAPGARSSIHGDTSTIGDMGGRPCAVFRYRGSSMSPDDAQRLLQD